MPLKRAEASTPLARRGIDPAPPPGTWELSGDDPGAQPPGVAEPAGAAFAAAVRRPIPIAVHEAAGPPLHDLLAASNQEAFDSDDDAAIHAHAYRQWGPSAGPRPLQYYRGSRRRLHVQAPPLPELLEPGPPADDGAPPLGSADDVEMADAFLRASRSGYSPSAGAPGAARNLSPRFALARFVLDARRATAENEYGPYRPRIWRPAQARRRGHGHVRRSAGSADAARQRASGRPIHDAEHHTAVAAGGAGNPSSSPA